MYGVNIGIPDKEHLVEPMRETQPAHDPARETPKPAPSRKEREKVAA